MGLELVYSPISGGYFIAQSAILGTLLEARRGLAQGSQPDAYFGASGGNLASILSLSFKDTSESVERTAKRLSSDMFVRNWWRGKLSVLPSAVAGVFKNSGIYREGKGADKLLEDVFTSQDILDGPEIWSLTFNTGVELGALNCSKPRANSIFADYLDDDYLIESGCGEVNYLDADLKRIADVTLASASIPGLKASVEIGGQRYVDGGIARATPGTFFNEAIIDLRDAVPAYSGYLHYYYILPSQLGDDTTRHNFIKSTESINGHWITRVVEYIKNFTVSATFTDKYSVFENWLRVAGLKRKNLTEITLTDVTANKLKPVLESLNDKHYFMIFYPTDDAAVDITDFDNKHLEENYTKALNSIKVEIYHSV
jgi:hypothetical protein